MIQFKRGKTASWQKQAKPLAAGQPGYDKDRNKLKIGDGEHSWNELPDASGLRADEILESEKKAKEKVRLAAGLNPLASLVTKLLKLEDRPIITYGEEAPDEETVGQIYLQHYDAEPEVDYIVSYGVDGIWTYQKLNSGIAKCWGKFSVETTFNNVHDNKIIYYSDEIATQSYPIKFVDVPCENVTLHGNRPMVWLTSRKANTSSTSGKYVIMSLNEWSNSSEFELAYSVEGRWK